MRDLTTLPTLTPETLLGSAPLAPAPGPVRFTLAPHVERERPTLLRECLARLGFRYDIERLSDVPFAADFTMNMLSGMLMATGRLHGSRNRRTRAHVEDGTDDAVLIVNIRGPHLIEQRNKEVVLGDGEAILVSASDPSAFTHKPPGNTLALRFPKARLAPLVKGGHDDCYMRPIPSDTEGLRFLTGYIGLAWEERTNATPALQHLMASHIYDLMAVMVGATADAAGAAAQGGGMRAARLQAIKQDIDRHLEQSDLSVAAVAGRNACTPRLVQRLFEMEGTTFTEYVLAQRLARARQRLLDPRHAGEKISAVAYDCGFGDVSYFNRVFRRHFAAAPSDVRAQAVRMLDAAE